MVPVLLEQRSWPRTSEVLILAGTSRGSRTRKLLGPKFGDAPGTCIQALTLVPFAVVFTCRNRAGPARAGWRRTTLSYMDAEIAIASSAPDPLSAARSGLA